MLSNEWVLNNKISGIKLVFSLYATMYTEDTIPIGFETQEVYFCSKWEQFLKLKWIKYFANDRWHSANISPFCRCNISIPSTLHIKFIYKTNQLHWKAIKEICMDNIYTGCNRRNGPDFGRVFLMLYYTDITQNTYVQSRTVTEIITREKCGLHRSRRTIRHPWRHTCPMRLPDNETL